jgi:hypothetical protein
LKYSIFSIARNALSLHERWPLAWRSPRPRQAYDAVIVGGGDERCLDQHRLRDAAFPLEIAGERCSAQRQDKGDSHRL